MADDKDRNDELYSGLKFLLKHSFPKKCPVCGRVYDSPESFISGTRALKGAPGFKESIDADEKKVVEVYRNCECGSTLMEVSRDRRDYSDEGRKRREQFERLLVILIESGVERAVARGELLKVMRGERSVLLEGMGIFKKP